MAFKQVKTDKEILWNGACLTPLATLADKYGGRAQIVNDDRCYLLLLKNGDGNYKQTPWWFSAAVAALKELPLPE